MGFHALWRIFNGFSDFLYHLFHACSCGATLWIRLLARPRDSPGLAGFEPGQLIIQQLEVVLSWPIERSLPFDIQEIRVGDDRRLATTDLASRDKSLPSDGAALTGQLAGRRREDINLIIAYGRWAVGLGTG